MGQASNGTDVDEIQDPSFPKHDRIDKPIFKNYCDYMRWHGCSPNHTQSTIRRKVGKSEMVKQHVAWKAIECQKSCGLCTPTAAAKEEKQNVFCSKGKCCDDADVGVGGGQHRDR